MFGASKANMSQPEFENIFKFARQKSIPNARTKTGLLKLILFNQCQTIKHLGRKYFERKLYKKRLEAI